nr:hypothetical protein [Rhodovulum sulfidophilum]
MRQDGDVEDQQDHEFRDHAHAEDMPRNRDVPPPQKHHRGEPGEGPDPPGQIETQRCGKARDEDREERENGDLDGEIGQKRRQRPAQPRRRAEAARDIGVERACAGHMPGHRGETGREDQVKDARQDEGAGDARAIAEGESGRGCADDSGHGRGRRDNEENDMRKPYRIGLKAVLALSFFHSTDPCCCVLRIGLQAAGQ